MKTPGQVGFTDDGARLIVTTKANGSMQVFDVDDDGLLSAEPVTNDQAPGVPFSFVTDEGAGSSSPTPPTRSTPSPSGRTTP